MKENNNIVENLKSCINNMYVDRVTPFYLAVIVTFVILLIINKLFGENLENWLLNRIEYFIFMSMICLFCGLTVFYVSKKVYFDKSFQRGLERMKKLASEEEDSIGTLEELQFTTGLLIKPIIIKKVLSKLKS